MRQLYVLIALFLFTQTTVAQTDFCVPGARWVYYTPGGPTVNLRETVFEYVGDTAVAGYSDVKKISAHEWWAIGFMQYPTGPINHQHWIKYVRQTNDSIMELVAGNWEVMFVNGLEVGETREIYLQSNDCSEYDTIEVVSLDTFSYGGVDFSRINYELLVQDQYDTSQIGYMPTFNGSYVERRGFSVASPTGGYFSCVGLAINESLPHYLWCYTDNEIINNGGEACDLILGASSDEEESRLDAILLNGQLQIQNAPNSTLHIYDPLGKELLQERVTSDDQSFDVSRLPNGILMVVVEAETGRFTKKVVKTSY